MASAPTGSGKTAAFALPVVQLCFEAKERDQSGDNRGDLAAKSSGVHRSNPAWRVSDLDRDDAIAIEPNSHGLLLKSKDPNHFAGCRSALGIDLSRLDGSSSDEIWWSFSCQILDDGIVRVGYATADASLQLGTDAEGWGYGSSGVKVHRKEYVPYGGRGSEGRQVERTSFGKGDVIGCHLRIMSNTQSTHGAAKKGIDPVVAVLSYSKNGLSLGEAFDIRRSVVGRASLYPSVCLKNAQCRLYFEENQPRSLATHGFRPLSSLPINKLAMNPRDSKSAACAKGPLAIALEPTRDLAEQTFRVFEDLTSRIKAIPVRPALLVGGVSPKGTLKMLEDNKVDILVGTAPIVAAYMKQSKIEPSRCKFFVVDEADELISTDSIQYINVIYSRLLASNHNVSRFDRLQICFFSATLERKEVQDLANTICHQPLWVNLRGQNDSILPDAVQHCFVKVSPEALVDRDFVQSDAVHRRGKLDQAVTLEGLSKEDADSERIKQLKFRVALAVMDAFSMDQVLVFCRTNLDCDLLEKYLKSHSWRGGVLDKYTCRVLAGMRPMRERQQSLKDFKNGEARILIATDVAARGIDIRELPFVMNVTLPDSSETYVHRCGRVGRSDRIGLAVSLVASVKERVWYCRPGKKPPCDDTRDFEKGGNCIWYDEPSLWKQVERLLIENKVNAVQLSYPELTIPPEMKRIVETGGYGELAKDGVQDTERNVIDPFQAKLTRLQAAEERLQNDYWRIRNATRFNG